MTPDVWDNASFDQLRAQGGFLVSAVGSQGKTDWVSIKSLAGEPCVLKVAGWTDAKTNSDIKLTKIADGEFSIDLKAGQEILLTSKNFKRKSTIADIAHDQADQNLYGVKKGQNLKEIMAYPEPEYHALTDVEVSSLLALREAVQKSDQIIVMKPGNYNLADLPDGSKELLCSGSNNTIDLTGVYVNAPVGTTRKAYITLSGHNNTFRGGTFEDTYTSGLKVVTDFSSYNKDRSTSARGLKGDAVMRVEGNKNLVIATKLIIRGSFPYGYGQIISRSQPLDFVLYPSQRSFFTCSMLLKQRLSDNSKRRY